MKVNRLLILSLISFSLFLGCATKKKAVLPAEEAVRKKSITRAEFAHLLATRLDWNSTEKRPRKVIIVDISKSSCRNEIKKVTGLGIMEIYPNHTFLPDKTLNRGNCAKIVENILVTVKGKEKWRKKYLAKPSSFPDVPNYHRHFNAIMLATKKDIMKPYRDGKFKPGRFLSRGEARRVVRRLERYFK